MKIHLHIGVHKTATTNFQETLSLEKEELKKRDIYYFDLDESRDFLQKTRKTHPETAPEEYCKFIRETAAGYSKVLISEENLIGNTSGIFYMAQPYQNCLKHLDICAKIFSEFDVSIFCSIRNLSTFLPSIYCEALFWSKYFDFKDVFKGEIDSLSWQHFFNRIFTLEKTINVWCYENYSESKKELLSKFSFGEHLDWKCDLVPISRQSPGSKIINCYKEIAHYLNGDHRKIYHILREQFPEDDQQEKFNPLNSDEISILNENYQKDLNELSSHPLVQFI